MSYTKVLSKIRCCVPGCYDEHKAGKRNDKVVLHRFPNPSKDRERLIAWVFSIGGDLVNLSSARVYRTRRICNDHFELKYKCRNSRLSNIAIPTLYLPGFRTKHDPYDPCDKKRINANQNDSEPKLNDTNNIQSLRNAEQPLDGLRETADESEVDDPHEGGAYSHVTDANALECNQSKVTFDHASDAGATEDVSDNEGVFGQLGNGCALGYDRSKDGTFGHASDADAMDDVSDKQGIFGHALDSSTVKYDQGKDGIFGNASNASAMKYDQGKDGIFGNASNASAMKYDQGKDGIFGYASDASAMKYDQGKDGIYGLASDASALEVSVKEDNTASVQVTKDLNTTGCMPKKNKSDDILIKNVCRICLRSDLTKRIELDGTLADFYDELVCFDTFEHASLTLCLCCETLLKKAYNFRQKCRRAHIVLKARCTNLNSWRLKSNLYKLLPKSTISLGSFKSVQKVYDFVWTEVEEELTPEQPTVMADENCNSSDSWTYLEADDKENIKLEQQANHTVAAFCPNDKKRIKTEQQANLTGAAFGPKDKKRKKAEQQVNHTGAASGPNDAEIKKLEQQYNHTGAAVSRLTFNRRKKGFVMKSTKVPLKNLTPEQLTLFKLNRKNDSVIKRKAKLIDMVVSLMDNGELQGIEHLGVTMDKELFLNTVDRCSYKTLLVKGVMSYGEIGVPKLRNFLKFLLNRYNPQYESMFEVEMLDTYEKKMQEFESRQHKKEFMEADHRCGICYKTFDVAYLHKYHLKWHEPALPASCPICKMRFKDSKTVNQHVFENHTNVYRCKLCPFFSHSTKRMKEHYFEHKGAEYQCPVCQKMFRNKSTMTNHKRLAHKTKHLCTFCGRCFASNLGMLMHVKLKHKEVTPAMMQAVPGAPCAQCDVAFHSKEALLAHVVKFHIDSWPRNVCSVCNEAFRTVAELHTHQMTMEHPGPKQRAEATGTHVTCPLCHEQVSLARYRKLSLYFHYKAEHPSVPYKKCTASRKYLCEHCGKGFVQIQGYKDHLNSHTGEKPYQCSECGERFARRWNARVHVERHGPPRHACSHCEELFHSTRAKTRHEKTHTEAAHSDSLALPMDSEHKIRKQRNGLSRKRRLQNPDVKEERVSKEVELYVKEDKSCVKNELYVKEDESYVKEDESYVKEDESYVKEDKLDVKDESYVQEDESYVKESQSYVKEDESYVNEDELMKNDDLSNVYIEFDDNYTQYVVNEEVIEYESE